VQQNLDEVRVMLKLDDRECYADYRRMLEKGSIDVVVVATPHAQHAEHVMAAAEAGYAVVCEKPMATTLEESVQVSEVIRRKGVPYSVVHNFLYTETMQRARAVVESGTIGKPHFGRGELLSLKPADFGPEMPDRSLAWRSQSAAGGGCLIDTAYHEIYSVETLIGSPIRYVEARVKTMALRIDVDDLAILMLEHENGAISTVSSSWCAPGFRSGRWCEVHGGLGSLHVEPTQSNGLWVYAHAQRKWEDADDPRSTGAKELTQAQSSGHEEFFRACFGALTLGSRPAVTPEAGRHNLAVIDAARKATDSRSAVAVTGAST
jgi:predicted dehydrogenase